MKLSLARLSPALLVSLSAALLAACSTTGSDETTDTTALAASLEVNEDGSDTTMSDAVEGEPLLLKGCGFELVREHVIDEFDSNGDGKLEGREGEAAESSFGPPPEGGRLERLDFADRPAPGIGGASGTEPADLPPRAAQRHHRMEQLAKIYDTNQDGALSDEEKEVLKADLDARCANRLKLLLAAFDADADGELSDAEWETAHEAIRARFEENHAKMIATFDADGDGTLNEEERSAAHAALRAALDARRDAEIAEFDTDGDGTLNEEERAALVLELRARVRGDAWTTVEDTVVPGEG